MNWFARLSFVLTVALSAGCPGDDDAPEIDAGGGADSSTIDGGAPADADTRDLLERLRTLPHVLDVEERPSDQFGYRFFVIGFEQPSDHGEPDGQKFRQSLALLHRDETAPTVLFTTGYMLFNESSQDEVTAYLNGNQLGVEHRYFESSRPSPSDWSTLTVKQSADDFHAIAESFKRLYPGAWVGTGGSKGGMTSIYHRRFYPDDLAATVAYVAPHSLGPGDLRYDDFLAEVVPAECNAKIQALQVDALTNRRAYLEEHTAATALANDFTFELYPIPLAVEFSVASLEFTFWQYGGVPYCDLLPGTDVPDAELATFLDEWSGAYGYADVFSYPMAPYSYQAAAELGYPGETSPHLDGLLIHQDGPFGNVFPEGVVPPAYDGDTMLDVGTWVQEEAGEILFIYGEFDPWTAGAFDTGGNPDVATYVVADGNHGASIAQLDEADRAAALDLLEAWTGVTPVQPSQKPVRRLIREPAMGLHRHLLQAR